MNLALCECIYIVYQIGIKLPTIHLSKTENGLEICSIPPLAISTTLSVCRSTANLPFPKLQYILSGVYFQFQKVTDEGLLFETVQRGLST